MQIELPDQEIASLKLTPEQARLELAVGLYAGRLVSLGRAARIAGIPYPQFLQEIGRHGITLNYTLEDAEHDLQLADELSRRGAEG